MKCGSRAVRDPRSELVIDRKTVGSLGSELEHAVQALRPVTQDALADAREDRHGLLSRAGAIVVGTRLPNGASARQRLIALRDRMPHVGLYVVARSARELECLLPRLADLGVDDAFCLESATDWRLLAEELDRRVHAPPPEEALRTLWKEWEANTQRALATYLVRNGFRPTNTTRVLAWFRVTGRTLRSHLRDAGLPSPGILHRFGVALHGHALWRRGAMERVARRLGLANARDLHVKRQRVEKRLAKWPVMRALLRRERPDG